MARLYDAFNALALGNAINSMQNERARQKISGLQALGGSLQDYFQQRDIERKEAAQKQSALDYLMGTGRMDEGKANGLVGSIGPGEAVKYFQGRLDDETDRQKQWGREDFVYDRNLKDSRYDRKNERDWQTIIRDEQWAHDKEVNAQALLDWMKRNGITYRQGIKQMAANAIMNQLGVVTSKDYGNSVQGIKDREAVANALKEFIKKNPEFAGLSGFSDIDLGDVDYEFLDDNIIKKFMELSDSTHTDDEREEYAKRLQDNSKLSYVMGSDKFNDAINKFIMNANNEELDRHLLLKDLIGKRTTAPQREREIETSDHKKRMESLRSEIIDAYNGKGSFPEINEAEFVELLKIFETAPWMLNHYKNKG